MATQPREFYVTHVIPYITTGSQEFPSWFNDRGCDVTFVEASFMSKHAITGSTTAYQGVAAHLVTSAGVHTTSLASYSYDAASKSATAYVAQALTLTGTTADLVIADGAGIALSSTITGSNTTISTGSLIQIRLREGSDTG